MTPETTQTSGSTLLQWPGQSSTPPAGGAAESGNPAPDATAEATAWKARAQTAQGMHRSEKARADALAVELAELKAQNQQLRAAQPLNLTPEQREAVDETTLGVIQSVAQQIVTNTMPPPPPPPPVQSATNAEEVFYAAIRRAVPQALNVFDKPEFHTWLTASGNYAVLDAAERNLDAPAAIGVFVRYLEASATPAHNPNAMPALPSVAAQAAAPTMTQPTAPAQGKQMTVSQWNAGMDRLPRMDSRSPAYGALRAELDAAVTAGLLPG